MSMEIPKSLSVGNFAVRCICTGDDHLSEKCRLFFPRQKKVSEVPVVQGPVVEINEETSVRVSYDHYVHEIDFVDLINDCRIFSVSCFSTSRVARKVEF